MVFLQALTNLKLHIHLRFASYKGWRFEVLNMSKSDFGGLKVLKKVLYDHDNYFCLSFPAAFSLVFSDKFEVFFLVLSPTFLSYEKVFKYW